MNYQVNRLVPNKNFLIEGLSYIGSPRSNTAMYVTKKVEALLFALKDVNSCLVFAETGIQVSDEMLEKHAFVFSAHPQLEYANFASQYAEGRFAEERALNNRLTSNGYYVTEDVTIPDDAYIETGCQIGPSVIIGKNARILKGCVIKHTTIGDNFMANEYAVIGSNGFTMTDDENDNKIRIPTLGRVIIGDNVEIGTHDNISCGSSGDTIIEDNVKIDAFVHVGHDDHLCQNAEIAAGTILGGFAKIGKGTFIGINSTVRNRISIGERSFISMASAVMKTVENNVKVVGSPARPLPTEKR